MQLERNTVTTSKERQTLSLLGFVRLDGLKGIQVNGKEFIIDPMVENFGNYCVENGRMIVVYDFEETEVWLINLCQITSYWWKETYRDLTSKLNLKGYKIIPIFNSDGGKISADDLWNRLADLDWQPQY